MKQLIILYLIFLFFQEFLFAQHNNFVFTKESVNNRIKTDIYVLASDSFMGRAAGSVGEMLARDYIIAKFKEAGISPYFGDTSYIQPFKINQTLFYSKNNYFGVNNNWYKLRKDFVPIIYSANDSVLAEMCYVKFGITAPSYNYDDYEKLTDLKGKIFVIELSIPGGFNKSSQFIDYASMSNKIELAIEKGAKGIIFINSDKKYPYQPVKLVSGFKTYSIPVIYSYLNLDDLISENTGIYKAYIQTEIMSENSGEAYNIAGYINNNATYSVVIGGHYDHIGFDKSVSYKPLTVQINNGADDNASGTAGIIELGRYLKYNGNRKYNYILIAFSAEELGLLGSEYFVKSKDFKKEQINYMINLDMIGKLDNTSKELQIWAVGSSKSFKPVIKSEQADPMNLKIIKGSVRDTDHYPFYKKQIPTLFFNTGLHSDYHENTDKPNKINYTGETEILTYIEKLILKFENQDKLIYRKAGFFAGFNAGFYTFTEYISRNNR